MILKITHNQHLQLHPQRGLVTMGGRHHLQLQEIRVCRESIVNQTTLHQRKLSVCFSMMKSYNMCLIKQTSMPTKQLQKRSQMTL